LTLLPKNIKNPLEKKIKTEEKPGTIPAELVVIAVGMNPDNALYFDCTKHHVAAELHVIGDAFEPGMAWQATKAGYRIAMML